MDHRISLLTTSIEDQYICKHSILFVGHSTVPTWVPYLQNIILMVSSSHLMVVISNMIVPSLYYLVPLFTSHMIVPSSQLWYLVLISYMMVPTSPLMISNITLVSTLILCHI